MGVERGEGNELTPNELVEWEESKEDKEKLMNLKDWTRCRRGVQVGNKRNICFPLYQ